jgi:hypothetical protein
MSWRRSAFACLGSPLAIGVLEVVGDRGAFGRVRGRRGLWGEFFGEGIVLLAERLQACLECVRMSLWTP